MKTAFFKIAIVFFLFNAVLFTGCSPEHSRNKLLGSWTSDQDDKKYSKNGLLDKTTFLLNSKVTFEMYQDGKVQDRFSAKYSFDKKLKRLTTITERREVVFKIIELSDESLILEDNERKAIIKYKRLE